jgi:glycosyltransferase involved in cell wall biosynthesis
VYYLYLVIKRRKINWVLGSKSLIMWLVLLLLFTFNTVLPSINIAYHLWLIFNIVLVFSVVGVVDEKEFAHKVLKLYLLSFGVMAIWGIIEFLIGFLGFNPSFITQWWIKGLFPRINGFSYEPSYYATYMLIGWTMTRVIAMNCNDYSKKEKRLIWVLLALNIIAMLLSSSRMGIACMLMFEGINWLRNLVEFIKTKDKKIIKFLVKDAIAVIAICACYIAMVWGIGEIEKNISKKQNPVVDTDIVNDINVPEVKPPHEDVKMQKILLNGTGIGNTSSHSVSERGDNLQNVLEVFKQSPILGKGLGGIYAEMCVNKGYNVYEVNPQDTVTGSCIFAEVLAASGIIGFIFFAVYIVNLIFKPLALSKKLNSKQRNIMVSLVLALAMELFILQFNQNILRAYLWIHIAVLSMYYFVMNKECEREKASSKVKIAVDARMINMSGIGTYIQNLMKNDCYDVALGKESEIKNVDDKIEVIDFNASIYGIKEQLKFPYRKLKKENIDVLHVPHYNVPIFYKGKMVVTIHDLIHLIHPEFLPNKFAYFYAKFMIWIALKKAKKIITVSQSTKNDILARFKVNPDKIEVIPNGVGEEFVNKDRKDIEYLYDKFNIPKDKKILMYVGNLKPHKNLERLLEAYSKTKTKDDTCLVLVGKAFEKYNVLGDRESKLCIKEKVIHTGIVTQEELVDLYNLADLFIFPSLYEGFGLPILEALSCGTPVICSNTSSMPEVGGDNTEYFDPYNENELTNKIDEQIKAKKNVSCEEWIEKFDWKLTANKTKVMFDKIN